MKGSRQESCPLLLSSDCGRGEVFRFSCCFQSYMFRCRTGNWVRVFKGLSRYVWDFCLVSKNYF